jgi:hypothetical protein
MHSYLLPDSLSREIKSAYRSINTLSDQQSLIDFLNSFSSIPQNISSQAGSSTITQTRRISISNKDFFSLLVFHVLDEIRNSQDLLRASIYQKLHRILELNPFGEIESPETSSGITRNLLSYAINIKDPEAVRILTIYQEDIYHPLVKKELKNLLANPSQISSLNSRKTLEIFNILINSGLGLDLQDLSLINYKFNELISQNFRQLQLLANKEIVIYKQEIPEAIESIRNLLTINRQISELDADPNQLNILRINGLEFFVNHLGLKNMLSKIKISQADNPKNSACTSCFTRVLRAKENFNNYLSRTNPELSQELNEFLARNDSTSAKSLNANNFIEGINSNRYGNPRTDVINPSYIGNGESRKIDALMFESGSIRLP